MTIATATGAAANVAFFIEVYRELQEEYSKVATILNISILLLQVV